MKNILEEKPTDELHGRTLFATKFVSDKDIKNKKILDIGCGFGWFELNVLKRGCKHISGLEISEKDLITVKKHIKNKNVSFKIGSALYLPFEDETFDTVVAWEVLEHIPKNKEEIMFKEVSRVLKPKGTFYLSTPRRSFFSNIFDPAWWFIGHRHYNKKDLIEYGKKIGFRLKKMIVKEGMWEIIGMNNLYIAKWIFRRRSFFEKIINQFQDKQYGGEKGFTHVFIKLKRI